MEEIWKDIKEHKGYFVSSLGRVMCNRKWRGSCSERIVKPRKHSRGYLNVNIDGKNIYIHRLVVEAFLPNPDNLPQVNHINEIKNDNRLENLEWISNVDNANYGNRNIRVTDKNSIPVICINIKTQEIKRYPSGRSASREAGVKQANVVSVLKNKYKQANGYVFIYEKEYLINQDQMLR